MASQNLEDVAEFLKKMKFKKVTLGGLSEKDVWKKIEKLNEEYKSVFAVQEAGFRSLLQERDEKIAELSRGKEGAS